MLSHRFSFDVRVVVVTVPLEVSSDHEQLLSCAQEVYLTTQLCNIIHTYITFKPFENHSIRSFETAAPEWRTVKRLIF